MSDQQDRDHDGVENGAQIGAVVLYATKRIGERQHGIALRLQRRRDHGPAARVGERAMHENDRRLVAAGRGRPIAAGRR